RVGIAAGDGALGQRHVHPVGCGPQRRGALRLQVVAFRRRQVHRQHVNVMRKAIDSGVGGADPAVRDAAEVLAILLSLFSSYTAEYMWPTMEHEPTVALKNLPKADPRLLVEEAVTAIVQVDGKVRDRLEVSPQIAPDELEALAR